MSDPETDATTTAPGPLAKPYLSFGDLREAHTALLRLDREMTDRDAFLDRVEEFCGRAHTTGALLDVDSERRAAQSLLNYWVATLYSGDRVPAETILADFDTSHITKIDDNLCPYPGSRPFHESDARNFYGRRIATEYISNRLKVDRLVVLIGPAGRGKTSLLLAGILPTLKFDDECANRKRFYFDVLVPGSDPLGNLERMIKSAPGEAGESTENPFHAFRRNSKHLLKLVEKTTELPTVIVVDQFDDIFNLSVDRKVLEAFVANLLQVAQDPRTPHTVLITMSDDCYDDEIKKLPKPFREQLEPAKWTLPPLGADEIGDAIKKPGEKVGLKFQETVLLSMIKEILAEPIGLPLLQFTLLKLWAKRNDINEIPDQAFTEMGGCRAAFVNTAEQVYRDLKPDDQQAMRQILMRMVRIDEGTVIGVPVVRKDLYNVDKQERMDYVLGRLIGEGLVRVSENPVPDDVQVELTHLSLTRAWSEMSTWVEGRKKTRQLMKAAFFAFVALLAFGLVAVVVVLAVGVVERHREKKEFLSHRIARQSDTLLAQHRFDVAALLALDALHMSDNPASRGSILNVLHLNPRPSKFLSKPDYDAADLAFSPDKKKLATLDKSGNISIWNVDTELTVETILSSANNADFPLMFSGDGKTLASGAGMLGVNALGPDPESNIRLWDVDNKTVKNLFVDGYFQPSTLAFSPNGTLLVSGGIDGRVIRWDLTKEKPEGVLMTTLPGSVKAVGVNSEGTLVACGSNDGTTLLWNTSSWQKPRVLGKPAKPQSDLDENEAVWSIAFSHDGKMLAVDTIKNTIVWNVASGEQLLTVSNEKENYGLLSAFSDDDKTLTAYSGDGNVFFWDIADGGRSQLHSPLDSSSFLALTADGSILALPNENGITIWNIAEGRPLTIGRALPNINALAFDPTPNSMILAAGLNEGQIILWDTAKREQIGKLEPGNKSAATMLAFSPDGRTLAEGLFDGTIVLWNVPERALMTNIKIGDGKFVDLTYSADARWLAAIISSRDVNQVVLRNLESGSELRVDDLRGVNSVALNNNGTILYAGSANGKVVAWDVVTKKQTVETRAQQSAITSVRLDPSGTKLATGTDRVLTIWDVNNLSADKPLFEASRVGVSQMAFAPGGQMLGVLTPFNPTAQRRQGGLVLVDLATGELLGNALPNVRGQMAFAFRSDSKVLATAESASSIDLWSLDINAAESFCTIANGNLSRDDWNTFVGGDRNYCLICPKFGPGPGVLDKASPCAYSGLASWW